MSQPYIDMTVCKSSVVIVFYSNNCCMTALMREFGVKVEQKDSTTVRIDILTCFKASVSITSRQAAVTAIHLNSPLKETRLQPLILLRLLLSLVCIKFTCVLWFSFHPDFQAVVSL